MFNQIRETRFQMGRRDRAAGFLPRMKDSAYLEGYLKDRPEGLDGVMQFFPSIESYMNWKFKDSRTPRT